MDFEHPRGRHALKGRFAVEDLGRSWSVAPQATPTGLIVTWTLLLNAIGLIVVAELGAFSSEEGPSPWLAVAGMAVEMPLLIGLWSHAAKQAAAGGPFFEIDRVHETLSLARDGAELRRADVRNVHVLKGWRMIGPNGNRTQTPWIEVAVTTNEDTGEPQRHVLVSSPRALLKDPSARLAQQVADELRVPLETQTIG